MDVVKVLGTKKNHKVFLYALSTCAWCKKTKKLLQDKGIEYEYVDVDKCSQKDLEKIKEDIDKRGARMSFPLVIVDDKTCINGYQEDQILEALQV
jgi:glutaredoxin-like protein NrdH